MDGDRSSPRLPLGCETAKTGSSTAAAFDGRLSHRGRDANGHANPAVMYRPRPSSTEPTAVPQLGAVYVCSVAPDAGHTLLLPGRLKFASDWLLPLGRRESRARGAQVSTARGISRRAWHVVTTAKPRQLYGVRVFSAEPAGHPPALQADGSHGRYVFGCGGESACSEGRITYCEKCRGKYSVLRRLSI